MLRYGILLCLWMCCIVVLDGSHSTANEAIHEERVRIVRKTYSVVPPFVLELKQPVDVVEATMYFDGGTLGVILEDADGKRLSASLPPRVSKHPTLARYVESHLYTGDTHWSKPGTSKIVIRGPEESAIYGILIRWNDRNADDDQKAVWYDYFQRFLSSLDIRYSRLCEE